jgi:spore germination protein YaaH
MPLAVVHPKSGRTIAAWLPTAFDADKARESFEANKALLDEVSPFWYTTSPEDGSLVVEPGGRDLSLVETAHAANVLVIPTIHNVYDPTAILSLLSEPARRKVHIEKILEEIRAYDFDGIDIDYEMLPPSARGPYSDFIIELSAALKAEGKLLTVAVHAKTSDAGGAGGFQDWVMLGQHCDRIRIMTYDFHWQGSQPGPIAPLGWVSAVTEYARSVLPPAKIQLGIPFYAYDWAAGEKARPLTWTDVQALINQYQPAVNLQERDASGPIEEAWFTYPAGRTMRTVWFASSRALEAKLELIEAEDLGGLAIWRLGNEDPRNWAVIRDRLVEHPAVIQRMFDTYMPEH